MRMVACDLDGTIVRPDGTVSRRTKEALTACERSDVQVVFVTGRPPRWVLPIAELTGHRGTVLCGNGAAVLDLTTGQVVGIAVGAAFALGAVVAALGPNEPERPPHGGGRRTRRRAAPGTG